MFIFFNTNNINQLFKVYSQISQKLINCLFHINKSNLQTLKKKRRKQEKHQDQNLK